MNVHSNFSSSVIIDNGSGCMKVGLSGSGKKPQKFPTIVGRPKSNAPQSTPKQTDICIGNDLDANKRKLYKLRYPMKEGIVEDWDDMQQIWKYAYSLLKVSPKKNPVLLTEIPFNSIKHRMKMFQIFFEKFEVPAVATQVQAVLSLFGSGKETGIVLDSGDSVSHVVPIYEGYSVTQSIQAINFGGRNVTEHLRKILKKVGVHLDSTAQFETVKEIKEKFCFVSSEVIRKSEKSTEKYELPDGQTIQLTSHEKEVGGILFAPYKVGLDHPSVVELVAQSLEKVDMDLRSTLCQQIVLAGGNTMLEGFPERFIIEMKKKNETLKKNAKCRVLAHPSRDTLCWQGGNIFVNLPSMQSQWITKDEYLEQRGRAITKKLL